MTRFAPLASLLALALTLGFASDAAAQGSRPYHTRRVKDLGTYKVATKTWIPRETSFLAFDPLESIYDNTCIPQTIAGVPQVNTIQQLTETEILVDTAQIPSTSNTVLLGTADVYTVQGWRWAVCPGEPAGGGLTMTATIFFLESLASCEGGGTPGATAPVLSSIQVTDIPTSVAQDCFVFDLDLTGTSLLFDIQGDGDGVFDGTAAGDPLDTFGVAMTMVRSDAAPFVSINSFGLAGDPGTDPDSFGCQDDLGNPGVGGFIGESTSFLNSSRHVDGSTGFGTNDFLESVNGTGPTCFFIAGGYALSEPGLPNPWASLHCEIYGIPFVPPVPLVDLCNGDGGDQMGCTDCMCMNNAMVGTVGGCLNSAATSARLLGSGTGSVGAADLRFEMSGGPPTVLAILNSGAEIAPNNMVNPCFGLDTGLQSMLFDGLRCAVQSTLRHGGRPVAADGTVGVSTNGWGPPDGPNIGTGGIAGNGGFVAGQTRYFQTIYRDDVAQVCNTALNTSQAVRVVFTP